MLMKISGVGWRGDFLEMWNVFIGEFSSKGRMNWGELFFDGS